MVKVSKRNRRDFEFYMTFPQELSFVDRETLGDGYGSSYSVSALEAFSLLESTGVAYLTSQPNELARALNGKANFNLTVKQWKEGLDEKTLTLKEIEDQLKQFNAPNWCYKIFENYLL
jgi:hypothetical protein